MKIAVSAITLNERDYIGRALESCSFADYICVVDGGSTDDTERQAELHSPEDVDIFWQMAPWTNHFGEQRQHALDLVPGDADWWMRIDADERYSDQLIKNIRATLATLPDEIIAIRIRQTNLIPNEEHYAASHGGWETWPRIWRNLRNGDKSAFHWMGQVHEHVAWMTHRGMIDIPEEKIATWNVQVYHYGWLERARRQAREDLYSKIPDSGVEKPGDLTERDYVIREVPV